MSELTIDWKSFYKPVVLEKNDYYRNTEKKANFLLLNELNQLKDLVDNLSDEHQAFRNNNKDSDLSFEVPMNIALVGDRGTGKTSLLKSLKNILEDDYYLFDGIINPKILSSDINILQIIMSYMYKTVVESNQDNLIDKATLINDMKEVMSLIAIEKSMDDYNKSDIPAIEILDNINGLVHLDKKIEKIFFEFMNFVKINDNKDYKNIVLIIDDLDLIEHKYIRKLFNEIERYLNSKIIIVLAYSEQQLEESLLKNELDENKELIDRDSLTVLKLKNRVKNRIMKLLPEHNKVKLYSQQELLLKPMRNIFDSLGITKEQIIANSLDYFPYLPESAKKTKESEENNVKEEKNDEGKNQECTVEDWIYNLIWKRTNLYIKPVDQSEPAHLALPSSLRELIQCIEFVSTMPKSIISEHSESDTEEKRDKNNFYNSIYESLKSFKDYFISKVQIYFNENEKIYLKNWDISSSYQKNFITLQFLLEKINSEDDKNNFLNQFVFNIAQVENYNIRLGDIYSLLTFIKNTNVKGTSDKFLLVYTIKVLYSIELMLNISHYLKDKSSTALQNYLELINTSFMSVRFSYIDYFDYYEDKYFLKYDKSNQEKLKDAFYFSEIAAYGDVIKNIDSRTSNFRYRHVYNFDRLDLVNTLTYKFGILVLPTKKFYVEKALKGVFDIYSKKSDEKKIDYILFSIFQIDNLVKEQYSRRIPGESKYGNKSIDYCFYTMKQVNTIITSMIIRKNKWKNIRSNAKYFSNILPGEICEYKAIYKDLDEDDNNKYEKFFSSGYGNSKEDDHADPNENITVTDNVTFTKKSDDSEFTINFNQRPVLIKSLNTFLEGDSSNDLPSNIKNELEKYISKKNDEKNLPYKNKIKDEIAEVSNILKGYAEQKE